MNYRIMASCEWINQPGGECVVTVLRSHKRFVFFGKEVKSTVRYRGDCTVWHEYPSGSRADSSTEQWLSGIWKRESWKAASSQA